MQQQRNEDFFSPYPRRRCINETKNVDPYRTRDGSLLEIESKRIREEMFEDAQGSVEKRAKTAGPGLPTLLKVDANSTILLAIRVVAGCHSCVPLTPRLHSSQNAGQQNYSRRGQKLF